MSVFVTSTEAVTRHGVFGIERQVPKIIRGIGTGVAAMAGRFPWGPEGLYEPGNPSDLLPTLAPNGCDRVGSTGWAALAEKSFPALKVSRVLGTAAAKASADIPEDGSGSVVDIVGVEAKYKGALGNSFVITISDASNGDADSFNLKVTLTGANGTTEDTANDIDFSEVDATAPDVTKATLVGAVTQLAAGRPANGTYSMAGGSDGTVIASDYIGTPNTAERGLAVFETDKTIRHVFVDDCGTGLRAAVNAGLQAHAILMGDREAYLNGDKSLSLSAVQTDKLNYTSERSHYCDGWYREFVDGQLVDVPPAPLAAAVASKVPPSLSIAWKGQPIGEMMAGIKELLTPRGETVLKQLADKGINTIIREENGSYRWESANVASYAASPETGTLTRRRMTDYIVISAARALRPYVDAPNISELHDEEELLLNNFLDGLKKNKAKDPFSLPYIVDFALEPRESANTNDSLAQNQFFLPFKVQTGSDQSWIFLLATIGPTVVITEQAT